MTELARLPDTRLRHFDQQFQLVNDLTGEPVEDMPYVIETSSGDTYAGVTDREGKTLRVGTLTAEEVLVTWGKDGEEKEEGT